MRFNFKLFLAILITINVVFAQDSIAIPWIKIQSIIKNIFGKGDDVLDTSKNLGKNSNETSGLGKSENILDGDSNSLFAVKVNRAAEQSNQVYNSEFYSYVYSKKIGKILKDHGLNNTDNIVDLNDFFNSSSEKVIANSDFDSFVAPFWLARFVRTSTYFNKSTNDEKKVIYCSFYDANFNFIFILQNEKNIALLSRQTLINKEIKKQRLHVLKDEPEYSIFSLQVEEGQKYPMLYFVLYANQKFHLFIHETGTYSPEEIFSMVSKKKDSLFLDSFFDSGSCFLVNKDGSLIENN